MGDINQTKIRSGTQLDPMHRPLTRPLVDPRQGDIENDAASTMQRSLLAIAGSLLVEISFPKLVLACTVSILLPGVLLGLAPLVATAWLSAMSWKISGLTGLGTAIALLSVAGLGWMGWRPLLRTAEQNFWSLNALAIQPAYAFCREAIRHLAELVLGRRIDDAAQRARLRAMSAAGSGLILCGLAVLVVWFAWPYTRWVATVADLSSLHWLIVAMLANAVVVVAGYLAIASLVWGVADASMDAPQDIAGFDISPTNDRTWRIVHLSDIHVVGERYGFRIESGRSGPRGNVRFEKVMAQLSAIDTVHPLDLVVISGDITDAGSSAEWAEFLDIIARYPDLTKRMLVLPGNHDVNIVDRTNPARLDLHFSPGKRLRQVRALSAIAALQAEKVQVVDHTTGQFKLTLSEAIAPHRKKIATFADTGTYQLSLGLGQLWDNLFPMVLPPDVEDGLGVVILNSNAETHFSFTNALGLVSGEQTRRLLSAVNQYPKAIWIVALHHHLMEYPMPVVAFSERIGTALINGSWFVRKLQTVSKRVVVMHGHRHIDWIGECGGLKILSAPSPVMGTTIGPTHFYIHTFARTQGGDLSLCQPERIDIAELI